MNQYTSVHVGKLNFIFFSHLDASFPACVTVSTWSTGVGHFYPPSALSVVRPVDVRTRSDA